MAKRTFEEWMKAVDAACQELTGLSIYDLPDVDYWSMWEEGVSVNGAVKRAKKNALN